MSLYIYCVDARMCTWCPYASRSELQFSSPLLHTSDEFGFRCWEKPFCCFAGWLALNYHFVDILNDISWIYIYKWYLNHLFVGWSWISLTSRDTRRVPMGDLPGHQDGYHDSGGWCHSFARGTLLGLSQDGFWLVVWNMNFIFHNIYIYYRNSHPNWLYNIFQRGW